MSFDLGLGFPEIASIALVLVVLVVGGLAALVWSVVRRIICRNAA
jgi:hypothetical protein